jgi:hypothetical protein
MSPPVRPGKRSLDIIIEQLDRKRIAFSILHVKEMTFRCPDTDRVAT